MTLDHRVAIALYEPAHATPYRQFSEILRIGAGTACGICNDVHRFIAKHLHHVWIEMTTRERFMQSMKGFHALGGVPMCIGAVHGSHIPVKAPRVRLEDYFNREFDQFAPPMIESAMGIKIQVHHQAWCIRDCRRNWISTPSPRHDSPAP